MQIALNLFHYSLLLFNSPGDGPATYYYKQLLDEDDKRTEEFACSVPTFHAGFFSFLHILPGFGRYFKSANLRAYFYVRWLHEDKDPIGCSTCSVFHSCRTYPEGLLPVNWSIAQGSTAKSNPCTFRYTAYCSVRRLHAPHSQSLNFVIYPEGLIPVIWSITQGLFANPKALHF
jgi:hypothetical protein